MTSCRRCGNLAIMMITRTQRSTCKWAKKVTRTRIHLTAEESNMPIIVKQRFEPNHRHSPERLGRLRRTIRRVSSF
jgi:hypothetical protein